MTHIDLDQLMFDLDIHPSPSLGQVFINDERIIKRQISFAELSPDDTILEIGPGLGSLTLQLAQNAGKVVAIEYDRRLFNYLRKIIPENVELIFGDAVKTDFPMFNKVVANIPYQISSPLIFKLINYQFDLAVLMLQAEFAARLISPEAAGKDEKRFFIHKYKPGSKKGMKNYSRLTVMASYYYDISFLLPVPKSCFTPVPKVDSALIKMVPKQQQTPAGDEALFANLVKVLFSERRKMIKNSLLRNFNNLFSGALKFSGTEVKQIIGQLPYMTNRPEQLELAEFIELSNILGSLLNNYQK